MVNMRRKHDVLIWKGCKYHQAVKFYLVSDHSNKTSIPEGRTNDRCLLKSSAARLSLSHRDVLNNWNKPGERICIQMSGASPTCTNVFDITHRYVRWNGTRSRRGLRECGTGWKISHLWGELMQGQMWDWLQNESLARGVHARPNVGLVGMWVICQGRSCKAIYRTGWKMSHLRGEFMQGQMFAVHSRSVDVCGYLKMISNGLSYVTWNIRA
jgi:hypothetical protein